MNLEEEEKTEINLIPTTQIKPKDRLIFDGDMPLNKLQVALGDGFKKEFNPTELVNELARVDATDIQFTKKNGDRIYTLKTNVSPQWKKNIREIGLYFKKENTWTLIAYYSQEEFLYNPEILSLTLVLPHKDDRDDTSSENNLEQKKTIKSSSLMASPSLGLSALSAAWSPKKKEYVWSKEFNNQIAVNKDDRRYANEPIDNIAARFDNLNSIYLLFKGKFSSNIYIRIYDTENNQLTSPFFSTELETLIHNTDGIFGQLKQREMKAYVSHPAGVWSLTIDLAGLLRSTGKQQYHPSTVGSNSTVFNIDDNACLAGGNIAGNNSGNSVSSCGWAYEGTACLAAQSYITYPREKPLTLYWDNKVYFFGGNLKLSDSAIEIKPIKVVANGNFWYFNQLSPETTIIPKINGLISDYNFLKTVNANTHVICKLGGKIFIFPRDIFNNEAEPPFFIYDILDQALSTGYLSNELQDKLFPEAKAKKYDSLQIVSAAERFAIFFLTASTRSYLSTQIISLDINP